jgi:hypothetical protein
MTTTPGPTHNEHEDLLTEVRRLIKQVEFLAGQVTALGSHISISKETALAADKAARRATFLTRIAVGVSIACLLLGGVDVYLFHNTRVNAVVACRNANESRAGNEAAWQFLIDASVSSNPAQTPAQQALTSRFQHWINTLYQQHDCSHLNRTYPVPAPPTLK